MKIQQRRQTNTAIQICIRYVSFEIKGGELLDILKGLNMMGGEAQKLGGDFHCVIVLMKAM